MLKRVLHAIESANGPVHVAELSQRLGIERSALEGMITYWVRKGRLQDDAQSDLACVPASGHCGSSCSGTATCAFIAKMPKSYSVRVNS
jgi:hypothetical protein